VVASRYTPEQRAEAVELYRTHGPTAVQKQLGIPKGTVTGWAKETGTRTVRTERTRDAVEAVKVDNKLRRQKIMDRMYRRAEFLLDRVEADTFDALVPSGPGVQSHEVLSFVPAPEERQLSAAMTSYLSNAEKLEKVDADRDTGEVGSVVDDLRNAFRVIAEQ
jgi:transposase-like protein